MIPCDGCLILPMCRLKSQIECNTLHAWGKSNKESWDNLFEFLPKYPNIRIHTTPERCGKTGYTTKILDIHMAKTSQSLIYEIEKIKARLR